MTRRPPPGLVLPVDLERLRDGDTAEVRIPGSSLIWPLRLIDCWTPEIRGSQKAMGHVSLGHAQALVEGCELYVHIPLPTRRNVLSHLTFDRIPAHLWLNENESFNERMVSDGYATKEKSSDPPPIFRSR